MSQPDGARGRRAVAAACGRSRGRARHHAARLTFLESRSATMPMACGVVHPSVLMPADAVRWPVERLRIVLLHELAHVKRRDCLTHVVVQLACAVYWFNPLAWIAARRIRDRTRARVRRSRAGGWNARSDYAEELLEIARVMRAGRFPSILAGATLAMAHRTQLEGRLIAILDPKVPRSGVTAMRAVMAAAVVASAAPLAALQPWAVAEAAAPAAVVEFAEATPQWWRGPQPQAPTPTPTPAPNRCTRRGSAHGAAPVHPEGANQAHAALPAHEQSHTSAQAAAQTAVQSVVQEAAQSVAQAVVQGAVQGAIQGTAAVVAQEAKRAAADPRTVAALTAALKDVGQGGPRDSDARARPAARSRRSSSRCVQALKDAAADVREQAARGLGQMHDKRAVDPLMSASRTRVRASARRSSARLASCVIRERSTRSWRALKDDEPGGPRAGGVRAGPAARPAVGRCAHRSVEGFERGRPRADRVRAEPASRQARVAGAQHAHEGSPTPEVREKARVRARTDARRQRRSRG